MGVETITARNSTPPLPSPCCSVTCPCMCQYDSGLVFAFLTSQQHLHFSILKTGQTMFLVWRYTFAACAEAEIGAKRNKLETLTVPSPEPE